VGDSTTANKLIPVRVTPASPVYPNTFKSVAAGYNHSLALRNDGTVWAWGANDYGQLGQGYAHGGSIGIFPVQVSTLPASLTVTEIVAGKYFSAVRLSDGTVRVWGLGTEGQLGNDSYNWFASGTPVQPSGLGNTVVALASGGSHILALLSNGNVCGWGSNSNGELGGMLPTRQLRPALVEGLNNVTAISAGASRSGAVLNNGTILLWGNTTNAVLGAAELGYRSTAVQLVDVKTAIAAYAGGDRAAIVRSNGRSYAWGKNNFSQLGNNSTDTLYTPTRIKSWPDPIAYALGSYHTVVNSATGLYAAGLNFSGQLGNGDPTAESAPIVVDISGTVTKIAASYNHNLALLNNGTVAAWGDNTFGQLGLDDAYISNPTIIPSLTNVIDIATGLYHSLALKSDGTVWALGDNSFGQAGGTGTNPVSTPTQVIGLNYIQTIAAGAFHSMALTSAAHPTTASRNRVYMWGNSSYGQVGNNTTTSRVTTPVLLSLNSIEGIAAGDCHSLVRRSNGTYAWGRNHRGQVGNGYTVTYDAETTAKVLIPTAVSGVPAALGITSIAAGMNSSYAVTSNGIAYGWGDATQGQLAYDPSRAVPVAWRLTNNPNDSDADGMIDSWEIANFGNTTSKAGYNDSDSDGLDDIVEHYLGRSPINGDSDGDLLNDFADSDPTSIWNGESINLRVISGDNQVGQIGNISTEPIVFSTNQPAAPVYITAIDPNEFVVAFVGSQFIGGSEIAIPPRYSREFQIDFYRATIGSHTINIRSGIDDIDAHYTTTYWNTFYDDEDGDGISNSEELNLGTDPLLRDSDGDGVKDGWDHAPLNPALSAPPNTSLLNINLVTPNTAILLN
jgi:alpha-tubulin suppressor-like RCC1 family protein